MLMTEKTRRREIRDVRESMSEDNEKNVPVCPVLLRIAGIYLLVM
jgi:hypothetical protein